MNECGSVHIPCPKYLGLRTFTCGSLNVLQHIRVVAILCMSTGPFGQTLVPSTLGLHMEFELDQSSGYREKKKMFENVDGGTALVFF